jgi:hypothetical protein
MISKDLEGVCETKLLTIRNMGEGYFVQEAMGVCHNIIDDMDKYTPWVWKEKNEWKTSLDY